MSAVIGDDFKRVKTYLSHSVFIGSTHVPMIGFGMCCLALVSWYMVSAARHSYPQSRRSARAFAGHRAQCWHALLTAASASLASQTLAKEIQSTYKTRLSLHSIDMQTHTKIELEEDGRFRIVSLGWHRRFWREMTMLVRLAICFFMTWQGTEYLVHTIGVEDLLLNAVALEFIMSTDELIYDALCPLRAKHLVENTIGLRVPSTKNIRWDGRSLVSLALVIGQMAWAGTILIPQLDVLQGVKDAICAGDQAFVYGIDGMGTVVWGYPHGIDSTQQDAGYTTWPEFHGDKGQNDIQTLDFNQGVIELILLGYGRGSCPADRCYNLDYSVPVALPIWERAGCCVPRQLKAPAIVSGKFSIKEKDSEDTVDASDIWNPSCGNLLDLVAYATNVLKGEIGTTLQRSDYAPDTSACGYCYPEFPFCEEGTYHGAYFNKSVKGVYNCRDVRCQDVLPYCNLAGTAVGIRARMMCPLNCGCDQPRSELALSVPSSGCPTRCHETATYEVQMAQLPCEDVPQNDTAFNRFLDNFELAAHSWPKDWLETANVTVRLLRTFGCSYLGMTSQDLVGVPSPAWPPDFGTGVNICVQGGSLHPVKPLSIVATAGLETAAIRIAPICSSRLLTPPYASPRPQLAVLSRFVWLSLRR